MSSLERFHPAVARWFSAHFPAPTAPQLAAWPAIASGRHTLIAAPTGSGKTLAAFLAAIDVLVREAVAGQIEDATRVVYVSPLKALSNDIQRNLEQPLAGIAAELAAMGLPAGAIRAQVRTGDTPPAVRTAMHRKPPHILVTTPESLYLLLTSASGRGLLATTRAVIVDEIHAVAGNKRGAHLALSLERLQGLCAQPLQRIGLSATQKPIEAIARYLTGAGAGAEGVGPGAGPGSDPDCAIVDAGHVRERDLALLLPDAPLEAVMSNDIWENVYDQLARLIREHRTTLVFANTRRMVERVTRHLSERIGEQHIAAHHGSLAKEQRLDAEQRLKAGTLQALVATASLELGIDIGEVDLVCQLGTPRSIGTFLQRVGRANHAVGGVPTGRLLPLSRDELIECTALLSAVRAGELDALRIPPGPLDVLAQQLVAEVSAREYGEDELYALVRRAGPYRALARGEFDEVVRMLADGFSARRGRQSAYLHRDAVNHRLRARRGARLTAITCGGAIPDTADYRVVLEPAGIFIGTLNEDFAVESLAGDVFQLGNCSYRILRVEAGSVRVEDARGQPPTMPFWLGEAPARSAELSAAVAALRAQVDAALPQVDAATIERCIELMMTRHQLAPAAARQLVEYLASAKAMLGALPTQRRLIVERFFDEAADMHLVVHGPFGSRINRAFGLTLRKRFCRAFNFELQAAATEDAIVLSLGETHSFALEQLPKFLSARTVEAVLVQAVLDAPLFTTRWRWNATIALAVRRARGGSRTPAPLQRMAAEDLIAVVFPDQLACAENLAGEREIPDHPLVRQTLWDCLHEAMDLDGLTALLTAMERGEIEVLARDLPQPSPLAQEVLNARPYAYLDDAPLEERRTQAVAGRRWLDAGSAAEFGQLSQAAIDAVRAEAQPSPDTADELHDALMLLGVLRANDDVRGALAAAMEELVRQRRATTLQLGARAGGAMSGGTVFWVAAEQLPMVRAIYPQAVQTSALTVPPEYAQRRWDAEEGTRELLRGQLQALGPSSAAALAALLSLTRERVEAALAALEAEGFVLQGHFTPRAGAGEPDAGATEWCERRLLARIHRYTLKSLRAEIEPVASADFMRFLLEWQGVTRAPQPEGTESLERVIEQLEGCEIPAAAWEADVLPARLRDYDGAWLDSLCLSGRAYWARLEPPQNVTAGPVRATPISLLTRKRRALWQQLASAGGGGAQLSATAVAMEQYLQQHGASFFDEIRQGAGLLPAQAEGALAELVAAGRVSADSFGGLRALLLPLQRKRKLAARGRRTLQFGLEEAGRWSLVHRQAPEAALAAAQGAAAARPPVPGAPGPAIEEAAWLLLRRYGVVFRRLLAREAAWLPPWYLLLRAYRRLEAQGHIRGGRFVAGASGEQYALPEAVGALRAVRRRARDGALVALSAADPLNLAGIVTPGSRVAALAGNRLLLRDGVAVATYTGGEVQFLEALPLPEQWQARNALLQPGRARARVGGHVAQIG
ncbi:MAG TPA: DEAD/DEAH box helicase [Steroidobacteraceae bacterium]|jgi:ATP-dependent Lhr-like helicase|nr:DEAD/DEAH box helicase [Steroidobacteraceae bacterium]